MVESELCKLQVGYGSDSWPDITIETFRSGNSLKKLQRVSKGGGNDKYKEAEHTGKVLSKSALITDRKRRDKGDQICITVFS